MPGTPHGLSRLRRQGKPTHPTFVLSIPSPTTRALLAAGMEGSLFECELTDEGLLFRLCPDGVPKALVELPAWVSNETET